MRLDEIAGHLRLFEAIILVFVGSVLIGNDSTISQWVGGASAVVGGVLLALWYDQRDSEVGQ